MSRFNALDAASRANLAQRITLYIRPLDTTGWLGRDFTAAEAAAVEDVVVVREWAVVSDQGSTASYLRLPIAASTTVRIRAGYIVRWNPALELLKNAPNHIAVGVAAGDALISPVDRIEAIGRRRFMSLST